MSEQYIDKIPLKDQVLVQEGTVLDFPLLPTRLQIENNQQFKEDEFDIKVGELVFDYEPLRRDVEEGTARLRLIKNGDQIGGFVAFTTESNEEPNCIRLIWVSPENRGKGFAKKLLQDSINNLPSGSIHMDIWGGEPMIRLAESQGFRQNSGGTMANRYTLER